MPSHGAKKSKGIGLSNSRLQCFLYHSLLAEGQGADCVAAIVKAARQFNAEHALTGLLVFDGWRFGQYLEGPAPALQGLIQRLSRDSRHTAFTPVLQAELEGARRYPIWSMAYAYVDEGDPLAALAKLEGASALQYWQALDSALDKA